MVSNPIPIDVASMYPAILIFLSVIFFSGVTILIIYYFYRYMRYKDYKCEIWEFNDDGHFVNVKTDDAGIFYDAQTKKINFFMRKARKALTTDFVPYTYRGNKKICYLLKVGVGNYHFINPKIKFDRLSLSVSEEDVNWAVDGYERGIKMVTNPDRLMQLLPYIIWALIIIGSLILVIQILKKADVIKDVMVLAKDMMTGIAKCSGVGETTIIQ